MPDCLRAIRELYQYEISLRLYFLFQSVLGMNLKQWSGQLVRMEVFLQCSGSKPNSNYFGCYYIRFKGQIICRFIWILFLFFYFFSHFPECCLVERIVDETKSPKKETEKGEKQLVPVLEFLNFHNEYITRRKFNDSPSVGC